MPFANFAMKFVGMLPDKYQSLAKQFIKFGVVGAIGAVVDFGTFAILTRGFGWTATYFVAGFELSSANNVSVFLAICSNFVLNRFWTFKATGGSAAGQGIGYLIMNIITWTLNQLLMSYFAYRLIIFQDIFGGQKDFAAKALAIGIILILNFLGSKFIVFRKKEPVSEV